MTTWSLTQLLTGLDDDIERRLDTARKTFAHSPTKGDASEHIWRDFLETYLPKRYQTATAHVADSKGNFSDQIDVVIFDRQYTPLIFQYEGQTIIPAESVYAVFESKQTISSEIVRYARQKAASVRNLHRTSLAIPHAGGKFEAKTPGPILAGILSFESNWNPALGEPLKTALEGGEQADSLDIGCIAANGVFQRSGQAVSLIPEKKAATAFLLELIARLQELATVPMVDVRAYAKWLENK
jgi:Domain of unknown function (DUF6602)